MSTEMKTPTAIPSVLDGSPRETDGRPVKKPRGLLRETWHLLWFNGRAFVAFELVYKIVGSFLLIPLLMTSANLCMAASGLEYVAPHNLTTFLTSPATIVSALVMLVVVAMYALVDACACVLLCQMSQQGKKASAVAIALAAVRRAVGVLKGRNLLFVPVMLVVLPMTNLVLTPSFLDTLEIPDFIVTYITYKEALMVAAVVVFAALVVYAVRLMFVFHFYVLRGQPFVEAQRNSFALGRGHVIKDMISCLLVELTYAVGIIVVAIALAFVVYMMGTLFQGFGNVGKVTTVVLSAGVLVITVVVGFVLFTCSTPLCYAAVSALYFRYLPEEETSTVALEPLASKNSKARRVARIGGVVVAYLAAVAVTVVYFMGIVTFEDEFGVNVGVVAHRCGANYAPENTVAALNKAADMGAEWCEIDVQMCADGSIIVIHDTNLERTGGLDANTWDVTYDEVKVLDSGSKFSQEFAGEPIPLLEDIIRAAQDRGVKLQIEIKPTGHDDGIEERVVEIVRALGFQDQCYLASMDYDCLKKIRACGGDDIRVLYIMAMAYGNIAAIPEADAYSVESTWVTETLADNVHSKHGAELCAWTVNSDSFMDRCILAGADQLVTDEVELAEDVVAETREEESLLLYILDAFHDANRQ